MNIALIFAGGTGNRMKAKDKPKQFLMVHGKPIIIHTIEHFQNHDDIDVIVVVCLNGWIDYLKEMVFRYRIDKVKKVVPGAETGQLSIYNGLLAANDLSNSTEDIVLIHDGVRPIINAELISRNIKSVKKYGSAITCSPAKETVVIVNDKGQLIHVPSREESRIAKAPQSFLLRDILSAHNEILKQGITNVIDSCTLMNYCKYDLHFVEGSVENIKITTPNDFYMFRALYDAIENQQLNCDNQC